MQATAAEARRIEIDWYYAGAHAQLRLETLVTRSGKDRVTRTLQSGNASPSGRFGHVGTWMFDVRPGDVYGFRMTGGVVDPAVLLRAELAIQMGGGGAAHGGGAAGAQACPIDSKSGSAPPA